MESAVALDKLLDFMPRFEIRHDGLKRVAMTNVTGWHNVPVRVLQRESLSTSVTGVPRPVRRMRLQKRVQQVDAGPTLSNPGDGITEQKNAFAQLCGRYIPDKVMHDDQTVHHRK
jgi:hypothetical protein